MVFDSDSESDEESDNPEEAETELETGESKQGNSQICDHSLCYSKLFLLFYKTKQNFRVPMLSFARLQTYGTNIAIEEIENIFCMFLLG